MFEFYTSGCVPLPGGICEWIQLLQSGSVGRQVKVPSCTNTSHDNKLS